MQQKKDFIKLQIQLYVYRIKACAQIDIHGRDAEKPLFGAWDIKEGGTPEEYYITENEIFQEFLPYDINDKIFFIRTAVYKKVMQTNKTKNPYIVPILQFCSHIEAGIQSIA